MSEMVERVARALARTRGATLLADEYWDQEVARYKELLAQYPAYEDSHSIIPDCFRDARAAIEAMREPTTQMLACRVSLPWDREDQSYYLDSETVGELWNDLIDAALTPAPPEH